MLILSRKCNEQIVIGDNIVVTIVAIRGGNVRIGIDAPTNVSVHREEVHRAIQEGKLNPVPPPPASFPPPASAANSGS